MTTRVFTNGNIMDVKQEKVFPGSILVEDGIIKAVGADVVCPEGAEVIDLGGKTVMPGLFNCHIHMCMDPTPNGVTEGSDAKITLTAIANLRRHLNSGTTFIRDVGGTNYIDIDLRDNAKAYGIQAPDMQVSGKCICMTGGHGWATGGRQADGPDECRKAAREQLRAGADWVKLMATGGVMTKGVEPGSPQLNEDELRAAIEEAHKVGAKTCTHAQGTEGIKNALRAGIDSIEHGFYMDDWCLDFMIENNVFYVPTLAAMYWIKVSGTEKGIPEYVMRKVNGAFDAHLATFKRAYEKGVKIALGTDAGTPFNRHDMTAYEMVLMVKAGMSKWDAIKAGTVNAAELCSVSATHGTIEVGKRANLTVFAENPAEDIEAVMDCRMTVVGGEVVFEK